MILNGKIVADTIKQQLKEEIDNAVASGKRAPHLVILTAGEDSASKIYVKNKMKVATEMGIIAWHFPMTADVNEAYIQGIIDKFNEDNNIDGIMVQLPLPSHLDERAIIDTIDPEKDVDGLTTTNIGRLRSGQPCIKPCTAAGIIDLLDYYHIELDGQDVTIIGRSNIVGKPLADMMMERGATVTQCHSHTRSIEDALDYADIVVSAVGKPKFLNHEPLSFWTDTIIDVGINHDENGKLCGDVDYDDIIEHRMDTINITPVPGGVGPMTVAELMKNTVECWRKNV
jgi:methylenetetrahydrofolate dehydrogenase (NADP+)/methenyltetrahydrofolate cyclohydrolase